MDLVSAQSLGYAEATQDTAPLVIPASAPLIWENEPLSIWTK